MCKRETDFFLVCLLHISPFLASVPTQPRRGTDSWPTCPNAVLSCTTHFHPVLIYQQALYQHDSSAPFPRLLLVFVKNGRWCFSLSFSPCPRRVQSAGEGGARGVVVSWPNCQPALRLHWCHWDSAHNGQIQSWFHLFFFFSVRIWLLLHTTALVLALNLVCGMKF